MERNQAANHDYGLAQRQQPRTGSPRTSANGHPHDPGQDSMFMKYASSIIQVVSQDRLEKSNQFNTSHDYPNAIIEVSEVNGFQGQSKLKNNEHSQVSKNSILGQHFMKKKKQPKIFAYNFTNFSFLVTSINKILTSVTKQALQIFITNLPKSQRDKPSIPSTVTSQKKVRSSMQSISTSYTAIQQFKSHRKFESNRKIGFSEQQKDGANAIKGWIQFKILLLQNSVFRSIHEYVQQLQEDQQYDELSPIAVSKRSKHIEKFCLTDYQPESSMNIDVNLHHLEESLAYTADNNFDQQSVKDYTVTTPQKLSQDERVQLKSKYMYGANPSEAKQSIVSAYKAHLKASKASKKSAFHEQKTTVSTLFPLNLKLSKQRRYLAIRTNLFELPMISEMDLRSNGTSSSTCSALMNDHMGRSEPQFCDQSELLLKDFQAINQILDTHTYRTSGNMDQSNKTNNSKQSFPNVRDKHSRVRTQASQQYEHGTRTCKLKAKNSMKILPEPEKPSVQIQERHAPHKIQNYYFPGKQLKNTYKRSQHNIEESTTRRLDDVKQVDSILSTVRKQPLRYTAKPHRIQQSLVNNYQITDDSKARYMMRSADGFAPKTERLERPQSKNIQPQQIVQQQYRPYQEMRSAEPSLLNNSNRPGTKINIALSSHRSESPSSNMLPLGSVNKKQQPMISPRNNKFSHPYGTPSQIYQRPSRPSPQMNNLRPSPNQYQLSKPMYQEEVGSTIRRMEPVIRSNSKDLPFQKNPSNVYQINQTNHFQQKTNITNIHNYQNNMRLTSKIMHHEPIHNYQNYGGNAKGQQPMQRPNSKIFSPQHCGPQQPVYTTSGRQGSAPKNPYFSPQVNKQTYGLQPPNIKYQQEKQQISQRPHISQPFTRVGETVQEYFKTETVQPRNSDKNNSFNNRYYVTGPSGRHPPMMTQRQPPPQPLDATRKVRPHGVVLARPHSSSRQSQERINIFSTLSPNDSQLEPHKRSFHHLSSCASKMVRPHSMNDKIQLTLRHR